MVSLKSRCEHRREEHVPELWGEAARDKPPHASRGALCAPARWFDPPSGGRESDAGAGARRRGASNGSAVSVVQEANVARQHRSARANLLGEGHAHPTRGTAHHGKHAPRGAETAGRGGVGRTPVGCDARTEARSAREPATAPTADRRGVEARLGEDRRVPVLQPAGAGRPSRRTPVTVPREPLT